MVVRPDFHTAKAAEIAFGLIGASALVEELDRVIDALSHPTGVKRIPARTFIGVENGKVGDMIADVGNGVTLIGNNEGQRPAFAFTHHDNALALA